MTNKSILPPPLPDQVSSTVPPKALPVLSVADTSPAAIPAPTPLPASRRPNRLSIMLGLLLVAGVIASPVYIWDPALPLIVNHRIGLTWICGLLAWLGIAVWRWLAASGGDDPQKTWQARRRTGRTAGRVFAAIPLLVIIWWLLPLDITTGSRFWLSVGTTVLSVELVGAMFAIYRGLVRLIDKLLEVMAGGKEYKIIHWFLRILAVIAILIGLGLTIVQWLK